MIQRRRRRSILFHLSILAILAFVGVFIAGLVASSAAYVVYRNEVSDFVSPDELAVNQPAVGAKILDRNGNLLYQVVSSDYGIRNPVTLDNVAPAFLAATIATEDKSFYQNAGINLQGILRASTENLNFLGGNDLFQGSGGSSITQQLVKNLYIPQDERYERSLDRKVKEVVYALEMTRRYSKDQILQWYVNQISYGGLLNGIEAASEGYFGKTASELTLAEAALIAGLPQSPAEYDPYEHPDTAIARRNEVLDLMAKMKRVQIGPDRYFDISQQDIDAAKDAPLELKPRDIDIRAPHFVLTYVMPRLEQMFGTEALQRDGLVIQTSLDLNLQNEVQGTLEKWVAQYEDASNSHNGAVTVLDSQTSQILVMLGSRDYYRKDIQGENNNLLALNSPGSSFKPFVYLTGFADLGWTPATMLDDKPTQYVESDGSIFVPHDPMKNQYLGRVTVRSALGNSLNIPAFNAAKAIGIQSIVDMAHKFGFTTFNGQYGPSIAIGGTDIRVLDLAYAYSTLARAGEMVGDPTVLPDDLDKRQMEPVSILSVKAADGTVLYDWNQRLLRTQVVSPEQAFLVTSILTDGHAECITFGCGGLQFSGMTVAVKTGTSEPFAPDGPDAGKIGETLAFGYTPDYVVGVWAGNADNSPVQNIYSTTIAYQIMHDAMLETYNGRQATPFAEPPGVTHVRICDGDGCRTDLALKSQVAELTRAAQSSPTPAVIDQRTGQPANDSTPPQFLVTATPTPTTTSANGQQNQAQAAPTPSPTSTPIPAATTAPTNSGGNAVPPSGGNPVAVITAPNGSVAAGSVVQITGTATSIAFDHYTLQYSSTALPGSWVTIGTSPTPVTSGTLGTWVLSGVPSGQYVIRLVVADKVGQTASSIAQIAVQ